MIDHKTVIAANRFGLGARPGELSRIGADPEGWLLRQVRGPAALPPAMSALRPYTEVLVEFRKARQAKNKVRRRAESDGGEPAMNLVRGVRDVLKPAYEAQALARYVAAVETELPFRERLTHFWTNHFSVSAGKAPVTGMAGALENMAIRPYVAGNFADMLLAVESHPAMLIYLDNIQSVGPNSRAAEFLADRGRAADINENLGREILELHTLGVGGGYTQDDVIALSKALTGWTVGSGRGGARDGAVGEFHFREEMHEPGKRTVMGKVYPQQGQAQCMAMLQDLARHPATARHLATKLVRHFVADDPPGAAVDRVAAAYLESHGDLPATYEALVASPEAWREPLAKYKTPSDYVVSGLRALAVTPESSRQLIGSLMVLGQPPYQPPSPAGWPDTTADWDGADALMARIEWAHEVGRRAGARIDPTAIAKASLGPVMSEQTRKAITRAESRVQGLTLLFASPEFIRR